MNYLSSVSDPLIADPATLRWDDEADMVVVGFGGAGATAALQARELGGDVIALDHVRRRNWIAYFLRMATFTGSQSAPVTTRAVASTTGVPGSVRPL